MNNKVIIAVDAMGGENAPKKILNGINISLKKNKENYFYLVGDKKIIRKLFIRMILFQMMKVLLLLQKKGKKLACGKL